MTKSKKSTGSVVGKPWKEFEVLVSRIERLLKPKGAIVKSPDFISDIDTGTPREVDASIKYSFDGRDILITLECRDRSGKQDVMWIDQLAGKMRHCGIDKTIGVSSKGFTAEAKRRATLSGIDLRKLDKIKDLDILSLFVLTMDYSGFKTIDCDFELYDSFHNSGVDYVSNLIKSKGLNAVRDEKMLYYSKSGTLISTFEVFQANYYKALAANDFKDVIIPENGDSPIIEMKMTFAPDELYITHDEKNTYLKSMTMKFFLYNRKEEINLSEKLDYVDEGNGDKLVEVHQYRTKNPNAIYNNFTYKVDLKTDSYSLFGEKSDGQERDFTGTPIGAN